ncbi:MAG: J domain-containing protein [Deltaproteobacteria bacterium]|nr:J domain-containing protein [Deltaproteobacteria bacterium]
MSLGRRLFDVARAELRHQARRLGSDAEAQAPAPDPDHSPSPRQPEPVVEPGLPPEIQRYYANLELPVGAPLEEVKGAYKRLMRRYHPDLHQQDPERAQAATRLAQALRSAYDGLVAYLSLKG